MEIRDKVSADAHREILRLRKVARCSAADGAYENAAVMRANCMRGLPQYFARGGARLARQRQFLF